MVGNLLFASAIGYGLLFLHKAASFEIHDYAVVLITDAVAKGFLPKYSI
jgi:hypothetical protein